MSYINNSYSNQRQISLNLKNSSILLSRLNKSQSLTKSKQSNKVQESLNYHEYPQPGKIGTQIYKDFSSIENLSLAYSPHVANPCLEIQKNKSNSYKYTNKGNLVGVISNGTAVLGLGNIGPDAGKPVMEGKSALMKAFANIDSFDVDINENEPEQLIKIIKSLEPTFGAINLEDIKAPECFQVENELKKIMNIPVFHDDQHGTAIVCLAGIINGLKIFNKQIENCKIVCNGAGAAGIACIQLLEHYGAQKQNIFLCDTQGLIYQNRTENMNIYKEQYANSTINQPQTLKETVVNADILIGVSVANQFNDEELIKSLNPNPIIFALANPNPEITPQQLKQYRQDCILATGRSDYHNQINNLLCFPYIFRAVLDCKALQINTEMKLSAAKCLAQIARQPKLDIVKKITKNYEEFGVEYIIPSPFDQRLFQTLPLEIIKTAIQTEATKIQDFDLNQYQQQLFNTQTILQDIYSKYRKD